MSNKFVISSTTIGIDRNIEKLISLQKKWSISCKKIQLSIKKNPIYEIFITK